VDGVNKEGEESGSEGALGCTQAHPNQPVQRVRDTRKQRG
jgi:hypothetical protein